MSPIKRKLKLSEIVDLYKALGSLNGYLKATNENMGVVPFKFTDETRRLVVKNRRVLKPLIEEHDELHLELLKEISGEEGKPGPGYIDDKDQARMAAYNERYRTMLKDDQDVELFRIEESTLLSENKNPIPTIALEHLWPITDPAPTEKNEPEGGEK